MASASGTTASDTVVNIAAAEAPPAPKATPPPAQAGSVPNNKIVPNPAPGAAGGGEPSEEELLAVTSKPLGDMDAMSDEERDEEEEEGDDDDDDEDDGADEEAKAKRRKAKKVMQLLLAVPVYIMAVLTLAGGVVLRWFEFERRVIGVYAWAWCFLFTGLVCTKFFSFWVVHMIMQQVEFLFARSAKMLYVLAPMTPVLCKGAWGVATLFVCTGLLVDNNGFFEKHDLFARVIAFCISWILFYVFMLGKIIISKSLAQRFRKEDFYHKIQDAVNNERLLVQLSEARRPDDELNGAASITSMSEDGDGARLLGKDSGNGGVSSLMRMTSKARQVGQKLTTAAASSAASSGGRSAQGFSLSAIIAEDKTRLTAAAMRARNRKTKQMARDLFDHLRLPGRASIRREDVEGMLSKKRINQAWRLLDPDRDGQLTLQEVISAYQKVANQRSELVRSLTDNDSIIASITMIISFFLKFIWGIIACSLFQVDVNSIFITMSGLLITFGFIFGPSLRNLFESMLFLFVTNPFDVGDNLFINGDWYYVRKVELLTTQMEKWPGKDSCLFPNVKLSMLAPLINVTRSGPWAERFMIWVDMIEGEDVLGKIQRVQKGLEQWVAGKDDYTGSGLTIGRIQHPMKLQLSWMVKFAMNYHDVPLMNKIRTGVILEICRLMKEEGISYTLPPMDMRGFVGKGGGEGGDGAGGDGRADAAGGAMVLGAAATADVVAAEAARAAMAVTASRTHEETQQDMTQSYEDFQAMQLQMNMVPSVLPGR